MRFGATKKTCSVFVFELEQQILPNVKKHLGPPLEREAECQKYLAKYLGDERVISGPYIEDGRWMVELPRKNPDAASLLKEKLADGGKNAGVADLIAKSIQKNLNVLVDAEVLQVYEENAEFAVFLTDFLLGKPFWLKTQ